MSKLCKKDYFVAIIKKLGGDISAYADTTEISNDNLPPDTELIDFAEHEIQLLNKKSTTEKKPTKTQEENEYFKDCMLDFMYDYDKPVSISDIIAGCEPISHLTNQRVSALMTQLKKSGQVERTEEKKKAVFTLSQATREWLRKVEEEEDTEEEEDNAQ